MSEENEQISYALTEHLVSQLVRPGYKMYTENHFLRETRRIMIYFDKCQGAVKVAKLDVDLCDLSKSI